MALRYLARTVGWDRHRRDSPAIPSDQDRQGAEAEGANKEMEEEVAHLLENLKSAGKEIDDETARIIGAEIARADAARGATRDARRNEGIRWSRLLGLAASFAAGFYLGAEFFRQVFIEKLTMLCAG